MCQGCCCTVKNAAIAGWGEEHAVGDMGACGDTVKEFAGGNVNDDEVVAIVSREVVDDQFAGVGKDDGLHGGTGIEHPGNFEPQIFGEQAAVAQREQAVVGTIGGQLTLLFDREVVGVEAVDVGAVDVVEGAVGVGEQGPAPDVIAAGEIGRSC